MANGMFDYFTNVASRLQPRRALDPRATIDEEHRRQRMLQTPASSIPAPPGGGFITPGMAAAMSPTASGAAAAPDTSSPVRPRLVPNVPPPAGTVPVEDDMQRRLQLARQQTDGLMNTTGEPTYGTDGRQTGGRVVNNDRGVLGRVGDVLRQAVISAGEQYNNTQGDPQQRLMAAVGGGIAGGFGGGFKPTLDEERQRLYDINRSQQNEQRIQGEIGADQAQQMRTAQIGAATAAPAIDAARVNATMAGVSADVMKTQQKQVFDTWQEAVKQGDFRVDNPKYSDLVLQAKQFNVPIFDSQPGAEYYGSWSPDGKFAILNKATGEERLGFGGQSFEKPAAVAESDLKDERFPWLLTDNDIKLRAMESVAPEVDSIEVNPQVQQDLVNYQNANGDFPYRNEDGSFNKNRFMQDTALDLAPAGYSSLYRNQAKSLANKVARKQREIIDSQRGSQAELSKFRLAIKGKPVTVANEAIDLFNTAMQSKDKKLRTRALKELYKQLG